MVKVIATSRGYFGGRIVEINDAFDCPVEIWNDEAKRPAWAILGGEAASTAIATVEGAKPEGQKPDPSEGVAAGDGDGSAVVVPADWSSLHHSKRKALAKQIAGEPVTDLATADSIIAAHVEATKPAPFSDAPAPQTVVEAQKATGGLEPDWVAPGAATQVAD